MSRLAVICGPDYFNKNLLDGLLDIYLWDDPDLELRIYNHARWGPEAWATVWAAEHDVDCHFHDRGWDRVAYSKEEEMLKCNMDMINDVDEALIFWGGSDESIIPSFDICKRQEKPQVIVISNGDQPCAIFTEY
jgi:hypothetical protein